MTYVLLDDNFGDHPKVEALSDKAFRAHVRALCWVKRHKTGGVIPKGAVVTICRGTNRTIVPELVRARLWEPQGDSWKIHDWDAWGNEDVELAAAVRSEADERRREISAKRAAAGRAGGLRSVEARRAKFGSAQPEAHEASLGSPAEARSPRAIARSRAGARPSESESTSESSGYPPENVVAKDLSGRGIEQPNHGDGGPPDSDRETVCPLDLEAKAVELGVIRQLAKGLGVTEDTVLEELQEFVKHWTIGGGAGQRRAHWMLRFRKRVKDRAERGLLKPPGLELHEQTSVDPKRIEAARRRGRAVRQRLEAERNGER